MKIPNFIISPWSGRVDMAAWGRDGFNRLRRNQNAKQETAGGC